MLRDYLSDSSEGSRLVEQLEGCLACTEDFIKMQLI